jgi:hypothetical protein
VRLLAPPLGVGSTITSASAAYDAGARSVDYAADLLGSALQANREVGIALEDAIALQIAKDAWMSRFGAIINGKLSDPIPTILIRGG